LTGLLIKDDEQALFISERNLCHTPTVLRRGVDINRSS